MDKAVLILQIVTIAISVASVAVNSFLTIGENRKKNYLSLTTSQRLKNMLNVREGAATIIALCSPHSINEAKRDHEVDFCRQIIKAGANVEMILKVSYAEEKELITQQNAVIESAIRLFNGAGGDEKTHIESVERYKQLVAIYDHADWKFFKKQSEGKILNSVDFFEIYNATRKEMTDATGIKGE